MPSHEDLHLRAWRAFLHSHSALMVRLEAELQERHGLSLPAYQVLLRLVEAEGGRLRMQDLVSTALMTKSGVSRLADRMEHDGLLTRECCPSDRRGAYAVLTPKGKQRLRRAAPVHLRGVREHFSCHLDDAEAATIETALLRVLEALSEAPPDGRRSVRDGGAAAVPAQN